MLRMLTAIILANYCLDLGSFGRHGLCGPVVGRMHLCKAPKLDVLRVPIIARFGVLASGDFSRVCCFHPFCKTTDHTEFCDLTLPPGGSEKEVPCGFYIGCLLYTSDAADE